MIAINIDLNAGLLILTTECIFVMLFGYIVHLDMRGCI